MSVQNSMAFQQPYHQNYVSLTEAEEIMMMRQRSRYQQQQQQQQHQQHLFPPQASEVQILSTPPFIRQQRALEKERQRQQESRDREFCRPRYPPPGPDPHSLPTPMFIRQRRQEEIARCERDAGCQPIFPSSRSVAASHHQQERVSRTQVYNHPQYQQPPPPRFPVSLTATTLPPVVAPYHWDVSPGPVKVLGCGYMAYDDDEAMCEPDDEYMDEEEVIMNTTAVAHTGHGGWEEDEQDVEEVDAQVQGGIYHHQGVGDDSMDDPEGYYDEEDEEETEEVESDEEGPLKEEYRTLDWNRPAPEQHLQQSFSNAPAAASAPMVASDLDRLFNGLRYLPPPTATWVQQQQQRQQQQQSFTDQQSTSHYSQVSSVKVANDSWNAVSAKDIIAPPFGHQIEQCQPVVVESTVQSPLATAVPLASYAAHAIYSLLQTEFGGRLDLGPLGSAVVDRSGAKKWWGALGGEQMTRGRSLTRDPLTPPMTWDKNVAGNLWGGFEDRSPSSGYVSSANGDNPFAQNLTSVFFFPRPPSKSFNRYSEHTPPPLSIEDVSTPHVAAAFRCSNVVKEYDPYHLGTAQPPPTFQAFVHQTLSQTLLAPKALFLALWYIGRMPIHSGGKEAGEAFRRDLLYSGDGEQVARRVLTLGLAWANKWLDDNTFTNKSWSDVTGISLLVLNKMEMDALSVAKFDLNVPVEEWIDWILRLQRGPLQNIVGKSLTSILSGLKETYGVEVIRPRMTRSNSKSLHRAPSVMAHQHHHDQQNTASYQERQYQSVAPFSYANAQYSSGVSVAAAAAAAIKHYQYYGSMLQPQIGDPHRFSPGSNIHHDNFGWTAGHSLVAGPRVAAW